MERLTVAPACITSTPSNPALLSAPPGFAMQRLVSALYNPTAMEIAPDGRVFVCEQAGISA